MCPSPSVVRKTLWSRPDMYRYNTYYPHLNLLGFEYCVPWTHIQSRPTLIYIYLFVFGKYSVWKTLCVLFKYAFSINFRDTQISNYWVLHFLQSFIPRGSGSNLTNLCIHCLSYLLFVVTFFAKMFFRICPRLVVFENSKPCFHFLANNNWKLKIKVNLALIFTSFWN